MVATQNVSLWSEEKIEYLLLNVRACISTFVLRSSRYESEMRRLVRGAPKRRAPDDVVYSKTLHTTLTVVTTDTFIAVAKQSVNDTATMILMPIARFPR